MILINSQTRTLRISGIDRMVIVSDDAEYFKSFAGDPGVSLKMVPTGTSHTYEKIRKMVRDEMETSGLPGKNLVVASDLPDIIRSLKKTGAALVLGFHRKGKERKELYEYGADYVADSISEIEIAAGPNGLVSYSQDLPGAFQYLNMDPFPFYHENPVFFFDYDGTLAHIVKDPAQANIKSSVRSLLNQLSDFYHVAIVSGRDLRDLRSFIRLDHLIYAGSHGFRIAGPGGISWTHSEAERITPLLDQVEKVLVGRLSSFPGVEIERKYSALAIHYRNSPAHTYKKINHFVDIMLQNHDDLRKSRGKKVIEIRPAFEWHKGKAVEWILRKMGLSFPDEYLPVYLGDDLTDEDAFKAISDYGTSILVGDHGRLSAADLQLSGVDQVEKLLHVLVQQAVLTEKRSLSFS